LYQFRYFIFAAILACLLCVQLAPAQTPASIVTVSGNGQIFCSCPAASGIDPLTGTFYPMVVLVKDANGKPLANATVNWNFTSPTGFGSFFGNVSTTTTAADGTTSNQFVPGGGAQGTPSTPPTSFFITATAGTATATFSLTQAYNAFGGSGQIAENTTSLPQAIAGDPIIASSGQQGYIFEGQAFQSLTMAVKTVGGTAVPGVSVRIINFQSSPTASCVTGSGADPGSVLTDANGTATCTPVFNGTGSGTFELVVGGVPLCNCSQDPPNATDLQAHNNLTGTNILDYYLNVPPPLPMQVSPAVPSSVAVASGSGQSATAGTALGLPLVAVVNTQGGGTLSGQAVTWSVSPGGAATLSNNTSTSDSSGQVTTNVTLNINAVGAVTVTATLNSNPSLKATFTITAISAITVGGLSKVSGDNQSAIISGTFANPLVVAVVSSTGAPVPGIPVNFAASNGAILSATQQSTGSNGRAQVTVTAPATAGTVIVTATAAGFTQTFNLTVSPPGPTLTANSFVNAADQQVGSLSPCSLATINAAGLVSGVQGVVSSSLFGLGPLSSTLGTDTVMFGNTPAPILNVGTLGTQQQLTFQVPCTAAPGSNAVTVAVGAGSATATVNLKPASPGVFQTSTPLTLANGSTYPMGVFLRPDGTFVTPANPARKGDTIVAYVTGLGLATPSVPTNALPLPTAISTANNTLVIGLANQGVSLVSAQLSPDLVGVYVVSFQIPTTEPSGNQVFSVGVTVGGQNYYSAGASIPIQ
jgi:uncharacterized protein (TIGR03437 family)